MSTPTAPSSEERAPAPAGDRSASDIGHAARTSERLYRIRNLIIVLFCVLGFVLGAIYLSLERIGLRHFTVVTGAAHVAPGAPAALRVTAKDRTNRRLLRVEVTGARWGLEGGQPAALPIQVEGNRPAVVRFETPEVVDGVHAVELTFRVGDEPKRALWVPLRVEAAAELTAPPPAPDPPPRVGGPLRLSIVHEDGVLLFGMDDRLFIRVLDPDGHPLGAQVTVRLTARDSRNVVTDRTGVATLALRAALPRYRSEIRAVDAAGRRGELREDLVPVPRGYRLRLRPRVVPPRGRFRLEIEAIEREGSLHCDVLRDGAPVDGFSLRVTRGFAATERRAPRAAGAYAVQCAPFVRSTGETYAARTLVVGTGAPLALLAAAVRPRHAQDATHLRALAILSAAASAETLGRTAEYLAARLVPDYVEPSELANTLAADNAVLTMERDNVRSKLLIALAVALAALSVWCVLVVGANVRAVRRGSAELAALAEEGGEGADQATDVSLAAARGIHHYVVLAVILVLNVYALLWLLATIAR